MVMAGSPPDLVIQQDFSALAKMGMFEPLDEWLDKKSLFDVSRDVFVKSLMDYSKLDDTLYTIPTLGVSYGLLIREDWLNKAGFQLSDLKNWDNLLTAAKAVTKDLNGDGRIDRWAFIYPTSLSRFAWRHAEIMAHSNAFRLEEVEENKEKYIELLNFIEAIQPYIPLGSITMGLQEAFQAYAMEKIGGMIAGSFFVANVVTMATEPLQHTRALPFPLGPSATNYRVPVNNAGYAVFKASSNKEAAWEILCYFTSKERVLGHAAMINLPALCRKESQP